METNDLIRLATLRSLTQSGAARSIRLTAGLSLAELASAIDVGSSTIRRWERNQRRPHGELALRYLDLLDQLMKVRL